MKNAIVIMNLRGVHQTGVAQIIPVENFSDENVKSALSSALKVEKEKLKCLSKSENPDGSIKITHGVHIIYGIEELYPKLENVLGSVQPYYAEFPSKHEHYIRIICATTENQIP